MVNFQLNHNVFTISYIIPEQMNNMCVCIRDTDKVCVFSCICHVVRTGMLIPPDMVG